MKHITAKHCAKFHSCLPVQRGNVRISKTAFINAILCVMENGYKRRAPPSRFGTWHLAYARFRRRFRSDVLDRLFAAPRDQHPVGRDPACLGRDSTSAEVHSNCTWAQSIGKSRGV